MKKFLAILCAAIIGVGAAYAEAPQRGDFAAGASINYGNLTKSFGFGFRAQYNPFIDNLRGEVSFNYFSKHNHVSAWDINLNAHYLIGLWAQRLYIYPIAGLNYTMASIDHDEENHVGLNLGAGAQFAIAERVNLFFEYRHTIERKIDQGVVSLGATYRF